MEALSKLGIDFKSILLYIVNFGLILFILGKYLYKPVLNMLDKRRGIIEGSLSEAETLKKEFQKKSEEMTAEREKMQRKIKEEMDKLKKFTEEKQNEMMKQMELERARMLEQASSDIEKKTKNMVQSAEKRILDVMKKIILEIVHHKIPENVIQESIKDAWEKEIK